MQYVITIFFNTCEQAEKYVPLLNEQEGDTATKIVPRTDGEFMICRNISSYEKLEKRCVIDYYLNGEKTGEIAGAWCLRNYEGESSSEDIIWGLDGGMYFPSSQKVFEEYMKGE